jgi:WD40 repeat protein
MLPITEFETVPGQSMLKGRIVQVTFSKPHAVRGFATSATLLNGRDVSADAFPASFDSAQTPPSEHVDLITVVTDQYEMQTVSISHFMQRYHDFQVSEDTDERDRRYVQSAPIFYPLFVSRPRTGDDFVHAASQAVADVANNCHDADTDFTMIAQSELTGFSAMSMPSMVRVHQSLQLLQNTHRRLKRAHERELKQNQEDALNSAWWSQDNGGAAVATTADSSTSKTSTNEKKDLSTFFDRLMTSDQQPMKTAHNLLDNAFDADVVSKSPQQLSGSSNALLPIEDLKLSLRQMRSGSVQSACSTDSNSQPASLEASFDSSHPETPQPAKFDPFAEMFATPAPTTAVKAERKLDELDSVDDVDRLRLLLRLRAAVADTMPAVESDEQQEDSVKGNDAGDGKCVISAPQAARVLYTADSKQAEVWLPLEQYTGQAYAPLQLMCEHWRQNIPVDRLLVVAAGGRFVLSAGYADTSIKAHSVATGQCMGSNAKAHLGAAITCLSLAADQPTTLLSGAADGSLSFWSLNLLDSSNATMLPPAVASSTAAPWLLNPLPEKATLSLCIHQSAVRDCAAHHALGLAVSVANAGYFLIDACCIFCSQICHFSIFSMQFFDGICSVFSASSTFPAKLLSTLVAAVSFPWSQSTRGRRRGSCYALASGVCFDLFSSETFFQFFNQFLVELFPSYIITMGLNKRGESVLWLLTVNGKLLVERRLNKQAERTMQLDVAFENQLDSEIGYNLDLDINYVDECKADSSVNNSHALLYVSRAGDMVFTSCGHFVSVRCTHTLQPIQVFECRSADAAAVVTSIDLTTDEKVMSVAMSDGTVLLFPLPHWYVVLFALSHSNLHRVQVLFVCFGRARHTAGGRDRLEFRLHRLHELEQQAVQEKLALEQEQLQRAQPQQDPVVVSPVASADKTESSLFDAFKKRFF